VFATANIKAIWADAGESPSADPVKDGEDDEDGKKPTKKRDPRQVFIKEGRTMRGPPR
jgi:hypothetical protein